LKYSVCYSVIRDTGIRPIEASRLRVRDIDRQNGLVYPHSAKHGSGRVLKLKPSTVAMLNTYISKYGLSENDFLWSNLKQVRDNWVRIRNAVSEKLGEPQLRNIKLYDLRHHFATRLYVKTKDLIYVQRQLGHKSISNTLRYIGVIDFDKEEYIVKVAETVEEVTALVESGFEYVTEIDGKKIFRKPKL
jgi:integrase/recombinase XerD